MKKIYACLILFLLSLTSFGQITNYNASGKVKPEPVSEKIVVTVDTFGVTNESASIFTAALGPIADASGDLIKTVISNREVSYTASYTGTYSGYPLLHNNSLLRIMGVTIKRLTKDKTGKETTASQLTLGVQQLGQAFRFTEKDIRFSLAKARISRKGKVVDLNIEIKVDAMWNDYSADTSKPTLKTATLGDYSLTIPGVSPGDTASDNTNTTPWYQIIPKARDGSEDSRSNGWYTLTVTVKEANPYGLTYQKVADFFSNNSSDIPNILKSLIPSSSSGN